MNQRLPEELYALSAASPLDASASSSTAFRGVFVDAPGGVETIEAWEVVHSGGVDTAHTARLRQQLKIC